MKLTRIGGLPAAPDGQDGNQPHSAPTGETGLECYGDVLGLYRIWGGISSTPGAVFGQGALQALDPPGFLQEIWITGFGRALTLVLLGWCHPAGTRVGNRVPQITGFPLDMDGNIICFSK